MAGRYVRTFECEDCGRETTRKWQGGRPLICILCAAVRHEIATRAALVAMEEHKRACRLELMALRAARPSEHSVLGVLLGPASPGTVG